MSRNDGNKERRQDIKKMARTMENIAKNEALLEESADDLTLVNWKKSAQVSIIKEIFKRSYEYN